MKIKRLTIVAASSVMAVVLVVQAEVCPNTYYSKNDKVSKCTECSTGKREADGAACSIRIYQDNVVCDCKANYKCYDDPDASTANYPYWVYAGQCYGGVCINEASPVAGPIDDPVKMKCADECGS